MFTKNKIFWLVIVFALGGLLGSRWQLNYDRKYYRELKEQLAVAQRSIPATVSLTVDNSTDPALTFGPYEFKANQTLFDLTKNAAQEKNLKFEFKDYGEMGYLVTRIGEAINGRDNKYWQYWVNNEQLQVAANKYIVKPGDIILWKFAGSEF